ncbi:hypothetical protein Glove_426g63 [Diversispora epigaea]|uniref:Cas12f1-like TNB domain-containing protein n=1 Tax=Diversispora epigaea TaxID=1348612 RepID=A0A397GY68_9GLOM|nr:hypothetical protein Glove_426g63 [Diversispora epigaea]
MELGSWYLIWISVLKIVKLENLLSIVTVFVVRHNGMCSVTNPLVEWKKIGRDRRRRQEVAKAQEEQELQDSSRQDTTYLSFFYTREKVETQMLDRNSAMDLQLSKSKGVYTFLCKIKSVKNLLAKFHYDAQLVINQLGEFYLLIVLDSSVRIFIIEYDPSEQAIEWSKNDIIHKYSWCWIIICTEEYTNKICGYCSHIHRKLNGFKMFRCPSCTAKLDWDINGACNILLHYLTIISKKLVYTDAGIYPWDLYDPCRIHIFFY